MEILKMNEATLKKKHKGRIIFLSICGVLIVLLLTLYLMASLVLCYPWTTGLNANKLKKDFPPTLFVLSGQDPISQKAKKYVKDMESTGLEPDVIEYENAVHSFIESNNPEGMIENSVDMSDVINSEQQSLAREAETAISEWIFGGVDCPAGSP